MSSSAPGRPLYGLAGCVTMVAILVGLWALIVAAGVIVFELLT